MSKPLYLLLSCFVVFVNSDGFCDKNDFDCIEKHSNNIVSLDDKLKFIEKLLHVNINKAYEEIKLLRLSESENPHVLYLQSQIQQELYTKLHIKMRDIGKLELLYPSMENLKKILKMPKVMS